MVTLENLQIAEEHVNWCRARGMTYVAIMRQVCPTQILRGRACHRTAVLAFARENARDRARMSALVIAPGKKPKQFDLLMWRQDAFREAA